MSTAQIFMVNMVKALGLDPDKINAEIRGMAAVARNIDGRLSNIENQNAEILRLMKGNIYVELRSPGPGNPILHASADGGGNAVGAKSGGNASEPRHNAEQRPGPAAINGTGERIP